MPPSAPFPFDLVQSLAAGKVRVFIGAGASCAAGLAGWGQLIQDMREQIRLQNTVFAKSDLEAFLATDDYLDIAELYRESVGDFTYFRFLRAHYRRDIAPSSLHRAIAELPIDTYFTSNYDKLFEAALRSVRKREPAMIIQPDQLNYIDENDIRVIKVHGDIDHPQSIVLTRSDYASYAVRNQELEAMLGSSVNSTTLLFVGFGLTDPNFVRIYNDARARETTNRQAYALMSGTNQVERKIWHDAGLTIYAVPNHAGHARAIKRLSSDAKGAA